MTQSPKKYVSTYTSSTTNRGVEAKEVEIGNIQLDTSSQYQESTDVEIRSQASADTGSYLQVVVQKHKKKEPTVAATQTSPRLPIASSPIKTIRNGSGDHPLYVLPHHMLVYNTLNHEKPEKKKLPTIKEPRRSFWSKFIENTKDTSPDKVDLYYFEKSTGDYLATSGNYTYTERFAVQMSRIPNRIVAEIFSIPQIIVNIPVAILLNLERAVFTTLRNIIVGSVQIWSDNFVKPILALLFNSIIQPPLVLAGNVGRSVRDALKPLAEMVGDFLEPAVKVLSAIRLVNIEKKCAHNV
ncbi:uncharacterized protein LOC134677071 isoform X1 [Cydia fagiglandana]|uniref:uncharacterized protein LOC134677071 isoform X1 n=1 Tax=Cydia fagiglandana TaxID=1458189 RepID=UPI002FEE07FF